MKHLQDYTENTEERIGVGTVLRLNQRERRVLAKQKHHYCGEGELWVQLPFGGMGVTDPGAFMETGLVTISHYTDKDRWYLGDERELSTLESMLTDDILAVQRMLNRRLTAGAQ